MRRAVWLTVLGGIVAASVASGVGEALAASAGPATKLSQQVAGGGVTVAATLLKDQADATAIKVVLDTHSGNLDGYKFEEIATLRDDTGKSYRVQAVEKAGGGGHHREAILRFPKATPETKSLELIVNNVAGVKERTFRWSLAD
jgi:hypothetical protein